MKTLEKTFTSRGYQFKQIHRDGHFAVYERFQIGINKKHYEVIKILNHNGYSIAGKKYPASEYYPSGNSWGSNGFTLATKEDAFKKIDAMLLKEAGDGNC